MQFLSLWFFQYRFSGATEWVKQDFPHIKLQQSAYSDVFSCRIYTIQQGWSTCSTCHQCHEQPPFVRDSKSGRGQGKQRQKEQEAESKVADWVGKGDQSGTQGESRANLQHSYQKVSPHYYAESNQWVLQVHSLICFIRYLSRILTSLITIF